MVIIPRSHFLIFTDEKENWGTEENLTCWKLQRKCHDSIPGATTTDSILLNHDIILSPQLKWSLNLNGLLTLELGQIQKWGLLFEIIKILGNGGG